MPECCGAVAEPGVTSGSTLIHPLDPLTPSEITDTTRLIRTAYPHKKWIFNSITLIEPQKILVLEYIAAEGRQDCKVPFIPRRSKTLLIENFTGKVFEVKVNLSSKVIEKYGEVPPGNQPTFTIEETILAEDIIRKDIEVQKRCFKLGLEDMDMVIADPW